LRDESRDTLHHPLTRLLAANVDVTIVRVAHEAMSPALQLLVKFIKHEVAEQRRKWTPLRSPFYARADQPVLHHPSIQGLRGSMGRRGNPYDNAKAESFMKTLKCEHVYLNEYRTFCRGR
jgi:transposase InsO family protein